MLEFLSHPLARSILLFAAMAILIAFGAYILSKWRGTIDENNMTTNELLTKFREMHSKGVLSDQEVRTIKTSLSEELQQELNDSGKRG